MLKKNKMNSNNLATVWAPNFFKSSDSQVDPNVLMNMATKSSFAMLTIIDNTPELFSEADLLIPSNDDYNQSFVFEDELDIGKRDDYDDEIPSFKKSIKSLSKKFKKRGSSSLPHIKNLFGSSDDTPNSTRKRKVETLFGDEESQNEEKKKKRKTRFLSRNFSNKKLDVKSFGIQTYYYNDSDQCHQEITKFFDQYNIIPKENRNSITDPASIFEVLFLSNHLRQVILIEDNKIAYDGSIPSSQLQLIDLLINKSNEKLKTPTLIKGQMLICGYSNDIWNKLILSEVLN